MAINKKLLHFVSKANFSTQLANSNIDSKSIVFIKDTGEIWTHDKLYSCASWGTNQTNYVPLTIGGTSYNISKDGHTHNYLPLSGGILSGKITINGRTYTPITAPTSQNLVLNGPDHDAAQVITEATSPGIGFHWPSRTYASLVYDGIFKFVNSTFTGYINVKANGFVKNRSTDSYVLLGGGGHALLSSLSDSHTHGLINSNFTVTVANTTTNSGWSMLNAPYGGFLLKSIRTEISAPSWLLGNFASGIVFGGSDTKGVISVAYNSPAIRVAGGNGSTPVWYVDLIHSSNISSQSVNYATSSGNSDTVDNQHFSYTNTSDSPTWLWASNSSGTNFLANRANISVNYANYSTKLQVIDNRGTDVLPNSYSDYRVTPFFNELTGVGTWASGITVAGWTAGYSRWQILGYSDTGANDNLYFRSQTNGGTNTWNTLRTILHSGNYTAYSPSLTGSGASGSWGISITGTASHLAIVSGGASSTWNWSGQGGQPTWLWGSNNGTDMYVYNPSNFNVSSAKNISNTGTVTLASATESNAITITAPSYSADKPVKLLDFNWYATTWSLGNIRGGGTDTHGLGIYLNGVEKFRFSDGTLKIGTNTIYHAGNFSVTLNGSSTTSANFYAPTSQLSVQASTNSYLIGATSTTSLNTVYSNAGIYMNGSKLFTGDIQASGNVTAANLWGISSKDITIALTTDWQDTGILLNDSILFSGGDGTYIIELYTNSYSVGSGYSMRYSGTMAVYTGSTNSTNTDEIILNSSGHSDSGRHIYLRTANQITPNYAKLQMSVSNNWTGSGTITIKTRRII